MADDNKQKQQRAEEIDRAVREHDARKKDANVDLGTERGSGSSGEHLDKFLSAMDAMSRKLDDAFDRLDHMEREDARRKDAHRKRDDDAHRRHEDDDDDGEDGEMREGRSPGEPREVVADSAARRNALADAQTRVDAVAQRFGQRGDGPLHGEGVMAYRRRQLRRYQRFCPMYKAADLDTINDPAVFAGVEEKIYADACAAADTVDIRPGTLRMRTRVTESGHRINDFFGEPQSWMDRFAGSRRYCTAIRTKFKSE